MTSLRSVALVSFMATYSMAFHASPRAPVMRRQTKGITSNVVLANSYLDSLSGATPFSAPPTYGSSSPSQVPDEPVMDPAASDRSTAFAHAPLEYFGLDNLAMKEPRATADWGGPQEGSRKMADDGVLRAGSWFCSRGGWPSPNQKAHTEIFYVLEGHASISDADGVKHYFGPGDTVTIPKGHTGRWDIVSPIHKIWAVNAHDRIEETANPIRVQVDHFHTSFAPRSLTVGDDPLYGTNSPVVASNTFYNVGPTKVGVWTCPPGYSISVKNGAKTFFHLLEGVVYVVDGPTGDARRCVAGDTVVLQEGWSGHIDVMKSAKKIWTTAA